MPNVYYFLDGQNIIECRFGLKQLKILNQISYNIDQDMKMLWQLGTGLEAIPQSLVSQFKECFAQLQIPSLTQIEEYYIAGLGELNISLQALESMTPEELDLAYTGYLRRQELTANLNKMAYAQSRTNNFDYIELSQPAIVQGNLQEREHIFKKLGIKEDK